jgi:hypothetical protein
MARSKTTPEFKIHSYVGTDIALPGQTGERPPRSAKLVVDIDMGSNPGSGDFRIYRISSNRERLLWILWLSAEDEDGAYTQHCRVATGRPYRGYPAKVAAEQLLTKAWQDERDKYSDQFQHIELLVPKGTLWIPHDTLVMNVGLLNQEDINRIRLTVFGE